MSLGVNQCSWHFHEIDEPCVKGVLGKFVVVYFDDILIYSKSYDDHPVQLRCVLEALKQEKLYANLEKMCDLYGPCSFSQLCCYFTRSVS